MNIKNEQPLEEINKLKKEYPDFFISLEKNKKEIGYRIDKKGFIHVYILKTIHNDQKKIFFNSEGKNEKFFNLIDDDGEIYFHGKEEYCIPSNTIFYGNVTISSYSNISEIGENVTVYGKLGICSDNLKIIGEKLHVNSLEISDTDNLKKIPDHTRVKLEMKLIDSNIEEFGKDIKAETMVIRGGIGKTRSIKNIENLNIDSLELYHEIRLNNINKIKNLKEIFMRNPFTFNEDEYNLLLNNATESTLEYINMYIFSLNKDMTENFLKAIQKIGRTNIYHNYLDFKSPNSFCSKLINEEYNLITDEEIQKYSNVKEFLIGENKIPVNMIDYCINNKGVLYLKKIGYQFTEEEFNKIINPEMKSYYERELIEQKVNTKNLSTTEKNLIKRKSL